MKTPASGMASMSVVICAYTEERWDDLVGAVASVLAQTHRPAEIVVVIDHDDACSSVRGDARGAVVIANDGTRASRAPGTAASGRRPGRWSPSSTTTRSPTPTGSPRSPRVRRPGRDRRRRLDLAALAGGPARLVSRGVPVGRRLHLPGHARDGGRGAQHDRRQHVRSAARCSTPGSRFASSVGQVGASMLRCDDTEFCIRVGQAWPQRRIVYWPAAAHVRHRVPAGRAPLGLLPRALLHRGPREGADRSARGRGRRALLRARARPLRALPSGVVPGIATRSGRPTRSRSAAPARSSSASALTTAGYVGGSLARRRRPAADARMTASSRHADHRGRSRGRAPRRTLAC